MILLRFRPYGSADWTEVIADGEQENLAVQTLAERLDQIDSLHVQVAEEGREWFDVPEFSFRREE